MAYHAKTIFTGYKLGFNTPHLYVAIPEKAFKSGVCEVYYKGEYKTFNILRCDAIKEFPDKFRKGKFYKLLYFLWEEVNE